MGTKAMVFPLDETGNIYVIVDENDRRIASGSRETCYRILEILTKPISSPLKTKPARAVHGRDAASPSARSGNAEIASPILQQPFKALPILSAYDASPVLFGRGLARVAAKFRKSI
jgi:hypothetical protein